MKMKPILFSTPMVRAIDADLKTKTRRVMTPQPKMDESGMWHWKDCQWMDGGLGFPKSGIEDYAKYHPGDILWVRETFLPFKDTFYYKADDKHLELAELGIRLKWRPSIHMPRVAARLFLRVKSVCVEQVQDITEEDARMEGIPDEWPMEALYCSECNGEGIIGVLHPVSLGFMEIDCPYCEKSTMRFRNLWDSLNTKRGYGWEKNPWVWVYEFEWISREAAYEPTTD